MNSITGASRYQTIVQTGKPEFVDKRGAAAGRKLQVDVGSTNVENEAEIIGQPTRCARRPNKEWSDVLYRAEEKWDTLFYKALDETVQFLVEMGRGMETAPIHKQEAGQTSGRPQAKDDGRSDSNQQISPTKDGALQKNAVTFVDFCEKKRKKIEKIRGDEEYKLFGRRVRVNKLSKYATAEESFKFYWQYHALTHFSSESYKYKLRDAVLMGYNSKCYIEDNPKLIYNGMRYPCVDGVRRGTVCGKTNDGTNVYLTSFLFRKVHRSGWLYPDNVVDTIFGKKPNFFEMNNSEEYEAGVMEHCLPRMIEIAMPHIHHLIERAVRGELNAIPRIHWWYVHLAPVSRGAGGVAELMICALCKYHGKVLPSWREGVAPSMEVILEPNEERFCNKYHQILECERDSFKDFFSKK